MTCHLVACKLQAFAVIILCTASSSCLAFAPSNSYLNNYNSIHNSDLHAPIGGVSLHTTLLTRQSSVTLSAQKQEQDQPKNDLKSKQEKLESLQIDIQKKFDEDRSYNAFGILTPLAKSLDSVSGDWALSYADLYPATPRTIEGQAFLATNVYDRARRDCILLLEFGKDREEVRLALLTDYLTAGAALVTGGLYMTDLGISGVPLDAAHIGA
eukprot:scaffold2430_cov277-Chaetoceros_neogracile.AAC.5